MTGTRSILDRLVGSLASAGLVRSPSKRRADRLATALRTLVTSRGEASGATLARRALALYRGLDDEGRLHFFESLARDFAPDRDELLAAAKAYHVDPSARRLAQLQRAAEPPRQEVFRRMNMAPGGTGTLVEMRHSLLQLVREHPELAAVDHDLTHLFSSWFNRGFLELRRIDWSTPAAILEKLIEYEAVHEIRGFPDLKRRLAADRRCFAFFHPALPGEPLVFVEVAFVDEMPAAVGPILALESEEGDPRRARCAVFYSITSCQPGLRGVSFGNFLIKQVAEDLRAELPNIKVYATLSPVPGLRAWVERKMPAAGVNPDAVPALAAWYLTREWREGHAADPVARFHLGNGARLERINPGADPSPKAHAQSYGLMVNYVYDLGDVERNHEAYMRRHHVVASGAVERLAKEAEPLLAPVPAAAPPAPVEGRPASPLGKS